MGEVRGASVLQEAAGGGGLLTLTPTRLAQITRPGSIHDAYAVEQLPFARGQFASVRKCTCRSTGRRFAAKVLRRRRRLSDIQHEIAVLDAFSDEQHIVQLHEVYQTTTEIILVLQMAAGGELQTLLDVEEFLEERTALRLIYQLLLALRPLHQNHIAHLDIKPQNVLLSGPLPEGRVKLCDFGISRCVNAGGELREIMGTPDYMAPEMLNYEPLSLATDMWSVGVLTYALLSGYTPFSGSSTQETYCNITAMPLDFPDQLFSHVSQTVRNFIAGLLVKNPNERRTLEECLNHPCMTDMVASVSGTRQTAPGLGLKEGPESRPGDQGLRGYSPADSGFSSPVSSDDEGTASRLSPLPQLPDPLPQLSKSTTASPRGTSTPSPRGTSTPSPRGTSTPTPRGTSTLSPRGTSTPSPRGTSTPTPRGTSTPSPRGTSTPSPRGTSAPSPRGTSTPRPRGTSTSRLQMSDAPASPQLPKKTSGVVGHVAGAQTRGRKNTTCSDRSSSVPPLKRGGAEIQRRLSPGERATGADPPVRTKRSEKTVCTGVRARAQANLLLLASDDPLNVLPLASSSSATAGPRGRHKLVCHLPSRS